MSESKELLEATIKGLQEKVNQLNTELITKQKELEDINKPEMTGEMYDMIESCIADGVDEACSNMSDSDVDVQYGMEYDGRVYIESFDIQDPSAITEMALNEINSKFKIEQTSSLGND